MESDLDLPAPIDDSISYIQQQHRHQHPPSVHQEEQEETEAARYYAEQQQQYMIQRQQQQMVYQHQQQQQPQKKGDIFSELERIHWIILISAVVLAFFMGKSISTPIIIRSV